MTYEELPIGRKIKIKERESDSLTRGTRITWKRYTVVGKYPHMCIAEDEKGSRRGLSIGDLVVNGIIKQDAKLEALRKGTRTGASGKGESWQ